MRNFARFLQSQGDNLVVAKFFGIELIGVYSLAMRFAELPTRQLIAPMLSPVYSGLAKKQDASAQFTRSVLHVIGATAAIILPAATLFASLSEPLVIAILGEKWQPSVPLVAPLTFAIAAVVLNNPAVTALTLIGRVKLLAGLHWLSAISLLAVMLFAAQFGDLEQLTLARALLAVVLLVLYYVYVRTLLQISWGNLVASIYRPGIASLVMAAVISALADSLQGLWAKIIVAGSLGGLTYCAVLYGLWYVAARPDSGEALLIRKVGQLLGRGFKRTKR